MMTMIDDDDSYHIRNRLQLYLDKYNEKPEVGLCLSMKVWKPKGKTNRREERERDKKKKIMRKRKRKKKQGREKEKEVSEWL